MEENRANKVLIVGDSLAGLPPDMNFAAILGEIRPDFNITVSTVSGDPLSGISRRLLESSSLSRPDIVIIEGGGNDILLPWLEKRGAAWGWAAKRIIRKGNTPTGDITEFKSLYSSTIEKAKAFTKEILVTTITCIGEDLLSEINRSRMEYNKVIRETSREHNLTLADTAAALDRVLGQAREPSQYLVDRFVYSFTDPFYLMRRGGGDRLSIKRGLELTVDGVHFNSLAARLFAETVDEALQRFHPSPVSNRLNPAGNS